MYRIDLFTNRQHFDWKAHNTGSIMEITEAVKHPIRHKCHIVFISKCLLVKDIA
jgi:hypothetical protein